MSQAFIEIEVEARQVTGKKGRREAEQKGMIPCIVYGGGKDPVPISVDPKKIISILRSEKGRNSILLFSLKGTKSQRHVMIRDFQINPITNELTHADFSRILMDQKLKVKVQLVFEGTAVGVKTEGGLVDVIMREVEVECLPTNIPNKIRVDITPLHVGDSVKIGDLQLGEGVRLTEDDTSLPVVVVAAPRVETEKTAEEEGAAEGEEAEPEVIGKGKKAESEEEKGE
jgi:large subunit ribosomal protein L25